MSWWMGHQATFAKPHECAGQAWTEAIAVLSEASAALRLRAAQIGRENSPGYGYGDWATEWDDLMRRADRMDELGHWLRDNMSLPKKESLRALLDEVSGGEK